MVVWLSCYAFVPVVFLMAYDKAKRFFNKCCKKKNANDINKNKINENISKEENDKLNDEIKNKEENPKTKNE